MTAFVHFNVKRLSSTSILTTTTNNLQIVIIYFVQYLQNKRNFKMTQQSIDIIAIHLPNQ